MLFFWRRTDKGFEVQWNGSGQVLRHTGAMVLFQATQDLRKVSLRLGHALMQTTELYQQAESMEKSDKMAPVTILLNITLNENIPQLFAARSRQCRMSRLY
ncbi:integrase [Oxalobacteraceae bacterium GrIS 1.11]